MTNIFLSVLGISVSIGFIVIVLILLTPFLNKRYAVKWKYLIWIFLALRLLVPFTGVNRQLIMGALSRTQSRTALSVGEQANNSPTDATMPSRPIIVEIPPQMTSPITVQSGKDQIGITMLDMAAFVWMLGSLLFISVHFISYARFQRQVKKNGKIIEDVSILCQISILKQILHIRRAIRAIEYHEASSPMMIGFFKPILVLPNEQYSSEELYFILKHEMVHLKRGDVYLKLLFVTATAVHWFNPLIWIMQKEASIDIELSCDERVTQGTSYSIRKAYTEILLSTLHKRCAKRTVLSTQFYGGTKIMKKRFKNILINHGKKNGVSILIGVIVLTFGFGTLVGCSIAKEDTENNTFENETNEPNDTTDVSDQPENTETPTEQIPVDPPSANNSTSENTTTLTFSKEGELEEKPATLVTGDGYSLYLPENEWQPAGPDLWQASVNEQVLLWIMHYKDASMDSVKQQVEEDGYVSVDDVMSKQNEDLIYHVELQESEHDIWGIYYSYPMEFEEGLGRELPVIANTFALSIDANSDLPEKTGEYLEEKDCQEIKTIVNAFAEAYFNGQADVLQQYLANTYDTTIDTYGSSGLISDQTIKGLSDADEKKIENGQYTVSLEFRDSIHNDMFQYLTFQLIQEDNSWKIQSYGVEG